MISSKTIQTIFNNSDDIKISNLNDLNLTIKDLSDSVRIITEWFRQQPHLSDITPDQRMVENIYIGCKGSIQRTKSSLDMYYTLRTALPEIFVNRDPLYPELGVCSEIVSYAYCPILTQSRARILFSKVGDPENLNVDHYLKRALMVYELKMLYDHGNPLIGVIDMTGITMAHIVKVPPTAIKILIKILQEALVARVEGLHAVNAPLYAHKIIDLVKSFLSPKIRSRVFIHKTMDDLHKVIDKKYLPKDFGGDLKSIEVLEEDWTQALIEHRDYFLEEDKYKTDESRRPGKPVVNELLGIHGSFRKLDVD